MLATPPRRPPPPPLTQPLLPPAPPPPPPAPAPPQPPLPPPSSPAAQAVPTAAPTPAARPANTLVPPTSITIAELLQRVHLPATTPDPPTAPHGRPRPGLTATLFSQLPHGIHRWFEVERLNINEPTTFTGLQTLRALLARANDPASRLAAATSTFAAASIDPDFLAEPDHGIPPCGATLSNCPRTTSRACTS